MKRSGHLRRMPRNAGIPASASPRPSARSTSTASEVKRPGLGTAGDLRASNACHGQELSPEAITNISRISLPTWLAQRGQHGAGGIRGIVQVGIRARLVLLGAAVEECGAHTAGNQQRDADPAGQFGGQRMGEAADREFRGAVGGGVADPLQAEGGCDCDDGSRHFSRYGSAALITATVPNRLTRTTFSQSSVSMSSSRPQASVPAAVTTATVRRRGRRAAQTAAAAAAESARSASAYGTSPAGATRSITAGVPPAPATAATTAAPRPLEPPVT